MIRCTQFIRGFTRTLLKGTPFLRGQFPNDIRSANENSEDEYAHRVMHAALIITLEHNIRQYHHCYNRIKL